MAAKGVEYWEGVVEGIRRALVFAKRRCWMDLEELERAIEREGKAAEDALKEAETPHG